MGQQAEAQLLGELRGNLESCTNGQAVGWAQTGQTGERVELEVLDGSVPVVRFLADMFRPDLAAAGIGDGRHSFSVAFPRPLSPLIAHEVAVRRVSDGAMLPQSPCLVPQATALDESLRITLDRMFANMASLAETPCALDSAIAFLDAQQERMRQARADLAGQRRERRQVATGHSAEPLPAQILFIDEATPDATRDAGSSALLSHMRAAMRLGFRATLVAGPALAHRGKLEAALEAEGIEVLCQPRESSVEDALRRRAGLCDVVYFHRLASLLRYAALAAHYMPAARRVFSVADLKSLRIERQGEVEARPELGRQARALRREEMFAAARCDAVITHSTVEARLMRRELPGALVHAVPWAVPARPVAAPFAERHDVAFIGSYAHEPNLDAAHHLVQDIMPLVWAQAPTVRLLLVGSGMPPGVRALAGPRVVAMGQVADLTDIFELVRLTVAPLRFGAGVKGKVMDSLAAGIPCACSPVAAEGLELPDESRIVGWTAPALAEVIVRLHNDESANAAAARAGLDWAASRLSEPQIDALLSNALGTIR